MYNADMHTTPTLRAGVLMSKAFVFSNRKAMTSRLSCATATNSSVRPSPSTYTHMQVHAGIHIHEDVYISVQVPYEDTCAHRPTLLKTNLCHTQWKHFTHFRILNMRSPNNTRPVVEGLVSAI